jgi:diguanylate cyclase (GGDEF)-like protein/PAS domain S-box-containing protein
MRTFLSILLVAGILTATVVVAVVLQDAAVASIRGAEQDNARKASQELAKTLQTTAFALRSVVGLFDASETVSASEFHAFARPLFGEQSALNAILWMPQITDHRRGAYEQANTPITEGPPTARQRAARRAVYFPVTYIETGSSRRAFGFDGASDPLRRVAMWRAIRRSQPQATTPVTLAGSGRPGIVLYQPVFAGHAVPTTRGGRGRTVGGIVAGTYQLDSLLASLSRSVPAGTKLQVRQDGAQISGPGRMDGESSQVAVVGHSWIVRASSNRSPSLAVPAAVLLAGAALALLVALMLRQAFTREAYALTMVKARMTERDAAEQRYQMVVSALYEGVVAYSASGEIVASNPRAQELLGMSEEQLRGRTPLDPRWHAIREDGTAWDPDELPTPRAFRTGEAQLGEVLGLHAADGELRWVLANATPLTSDSGQLTGVVTSFFDITEQRVAEQNARFTQTRLQSILDHLPLAIYLRDLDDRYQVVNAKFAAEFGLPADQIIGMTAQQLHPESLNEWAHELERPVRERGEAVAGESAAPHPDGTEHYHWVIKYPVNDENGALTAIGGAILDITDRRRAELAVAAAEAEQAALRRVATSVAQGLGSAVVFAHVAEEVALLLGVGAGVVLRYESDEEAVVLGSWMTDPSMVMPSPIKLDGTTATSLVARTGRTSRMEHYQSDDVIGSSRPTAGVAAPIMIAGRLWGAVAVGVMNDAPLPPDAEQRLERFAALAGTAIGNADARDALARLAATDELSGLANYRTFRDRLSMEGERAKRHGRPLSLVLLDVDHFKLINDKHGHGVGDKVLIEFARRLTAQVRDSDLVARVGGEEFALLLPETDAAGALTTAERIRAAVEQGPFDIVGRVTVSLGVCSLEESNGADSLVLLADTALYWAKNSGRNTSFCYSDKTPAALQTSAN